ncbi:PREDICTED: lysoplasmalogenase-like protein TMEM86A [Nanorana parkeri]|uniref:lysoplasmalogenase-like protein TMEM86A n=1 Tax=Nanorana parkeri TaxID=125878 RepID=UPI0008546C10|nr:PREDICTED: lysoplasmalogenase-like protein TMEM86A [Nanorana parkeri]
MDILETDSRYKKSSLANVKRTISKLLPFLVTVCNYFVLWIPLSEPGWYNALIKCLPIICLEFFIVVHSIGSGKFSSYAKKILLGLAFSAAGDVCLVWPEYFQLGMVMFGLAHILYTIAFGFHPLNIRLFIIFALFCATFYSLTIPYLSGPFIYMVAGYSMLISTMAWRALSRVKLASHDFSWAHISSALGSISFMISDCVLAVDKFCFPFSNARAIVMSTYYGAQLLISLSVIGPSQDEFLWKSR